MYEVKVISLNNTTDTIKGIEFKFFEAIDNVKVKSKYQLNTEVFKLVYGRDAKNGEIGCTLSHFELISDFSDSDLDNKWLVILEDDAMLEENFQDVAESIVLKNCNEPSIYLLGISKTLKKNNFIHKLKWNLEKPTDFSGVKYGYANINHCGTVGYIINIKAARLIASRSENIFWLADDWRVIGNMGINIYVPNEPVVYEDLKSISSIGNEVKCYNSIISNFKENSYLISRSFFKRLLK